MKIRLNKHCHVVATKAFFNENPFTVCKKGVHKRYIGFLRQKNMERFNQKEAK